MIYPDVAVVQPTHIDFPLFRYQIRQYRDYFNKVFIVFSEHHQGKNISDSIQDMMKPDRITFLPPASALGFGDWRDRAVRRVLGLSDTSHLLFLEQDFIIHSEELLPLVLNCSHDIVGFQENRLGRFHPAFLFVKREYLDCTSLDFSAGNKVLKNYDKKGQTEIDVRLMDHFGLVSYELQEKFPYICLEGLGFNSPEDYYHMAGLTHNYNLIINNQSVTYKPEEFKDYNKKLLNLAIEQDKFFLDIIHRSINANP